MLLCTSDATCSVAVDARRCRAAPATCWTASSSKPLENTAEPAEQPLLVGVEQPVRPLDRRPHRARAGRRRRGAARSQHAEPVVEGVDDGRRRRAWRPGPRRARWPAGCRRAGAQSARPATAARRRRGRRRRRRPAGGTARPAVVAGSQRAHGDDVLPVDAQRLAARGQHRAARGRRRRARRSTAASRGRRRARSCRRRATRGAPAEGVGDGRAARRSATPVAPTARAIGVDDVVGVGRRRPARRTTPSARGRSRSAATLHGEPGLADPADAGQRHDPLVLGQRPTTRSASALAADERRALAPAGWSRRRSTPRTAGNVRRQVGVDDLPQPLRLGRGRAAGACRGRRARRAPSPTRSSAARHVRQQDLAAVADRHDAGGPVDRPAAEVVADPLHLAGVDAHAHARARARGSSRWAVDGGADAPRRPTSNAAAMPSPIVANTSPAGRRRRPCAARRSARSTRSAIVGDSSHWRVEPSMSVNRKVIVPLGVLSSSARSARSAVGVEVSPPL